MSAVLDNAASLSAWIATVNDEYFEHQEPKIHNAIHVGSSNQAVVEITRSTDIPGSVLKDFIKRAETLGAERIGLKMTGVVYATFRA